MDLVELLEGHVLGWKYAAMAIAHILFVTGTGLGSPICDRPSSPGKALRAGPFSALHP
jgi:hypothetical protein